METYPPRFNKEEAAIRLSKSTRMATLEMKIHTRASSSLNRPNHTQNSVSQSIKSLI